MSYGTPTPRGIRKPNADELAQLWRLLGENADDTDAAIDDLDTALSGDIATLATAIADTYTEAEVDALLAALSGTYVAKDGVGAATVATSETTTSTTFTDLATVGPAVTVTVPSSGRVLVILSAQVSNSTAGSHATMDVALSGANTRAANVATSLRIRAAAANQIMRASSMFLLSGLAAGSTTFTAKYLVEANTGTFTNRELIVIPL